MRLANHHVVTRFLFPVCRERFVVLLVQLASGSYDTFSNWISLARTLVDASNNVKPTPILFIAQLSVVFDECSVPETELMIKE